MKRTKIYIFLMLLGMVFLFDGCKKDKDDDGPIGKSCEELATDYVNAYTTFAGAMTEANCEAWKDALEDFIKGCPVYAGYNMEELQQELDEIDCSQFNQ